jgi:hypothetical protein
VINHRLYNQAANKEPIERICASALLLEKKRAEITRPFSRLEEDPKSVRSVITWYADSYSFGRGISERVAAFDCDRIDPTIRLA